LPGQDMDKRKSPNGLPTVNKEPTSQNEEKMIRAAELLIANKELAFQNREKEKRAAELLIANKELAFQNGEKEKRAAELLIANKELAFQNREKEKRAAELIVANKELSFQNEEKEKRAAELTIANRKLKKTEENLKEYIQGLKELMFVTSHKVRQPIANILGLSNLLERSKNSPDELRKLTGYLKQSALTLDIFTKELTTLMSGLKKKGRNKNGHNILPKVKSI